MTVPGQSYGGCQTAWEEAVDLYAGRTSLAYELAFIRIEASWSSFKPKLVVKIIIYKIENMTAHEMTLHSVSHFTFTPCLVYASVYLLYGLLAFGFCLYVCCYGCSCVYCISFHGHSSARCHLP